MMTTVGYARVSSLGQDLAVQLKKLKGCDKVFKDKRSRLASNIFERATLCLSPSSIGWLGRHPTFTA